ncbi:MAG: tetratricopeptide repeat protein [Candidatus Bipolaricaulota bacterium]|nr:tetratricopeptide repeat protein [Candidatus Bipolaricaulota bacterium]MBS3791924.1 tetratricopeptide repeat protein [Candidatus Bipolaricaulota bacterium]
MNRFFDRHKKTIIWIMVIGFFLGSVGLAAFQYMRPGGGGSSSDSSSEKRVALVVNGEEVTNAEFQNAYDNAIERQKSLYSQFGQDFSRLLEGASGKLYELRMKSRTVESLIERELVAQEADKRGIKPQSGEVDQKYNEQLDSILNQQGWTLDQLKRALSAQGRSFDEFEKSMRESVRQQLKQEELKSQVVGDIQPADEELKSYYDENIDQYVENPGRVKTSNLVFNTQSGAESVKKKAEENPDYFEEYAEENDLDPNPGWFSKGEKPRNVEDLAFSLEVGEVGGPIKTSDGWELLKVEDKEERSVPEFEEIRDQVRDDYVNQEEQKRYNDWLEQVKGEGTIEIRLPVVKAYRKAQESFQEGLEAYLELKSDNPSIDPYLPYYIGRLYERRTSGLREEESAEDEEAEVQEKIEEYRQKAVDNYMEVVRETGAGAGDLLNRVVQLDSDNPEANFYLGRYQFQQKQYSSAASSFEKAIEARPDYVAAYMEYGKLLVELRNYEEAAEKYRKALDLAGDNVSILNNLADAYMKSGQYEKAEETYNRVLEESPNNFEAFKGLGDLYLEQENYEEAVDYYNDALSVRADLEASLNLARAYLNSGRLEDAKSELDSTLTANPYSGEGYMLVGDYYRKKDLPDRALEEYRQGLSRTQNQEIRSKISKRIVDLAPEDTEARFTLARAYRDQHVYDSAIDQYESILEITGESSEKREAYLGLGEVYLNKTDYDKAKEFFEEGLSVTEDPVRRVSFYEGLLKADEEQHGEDQLSEVGKEALLKIAEVNINQGSRSEAKKKLERLAELDPEYRKDRVQELLGQVNATG